MVVEEGFGLLLAGRGRQLWCGSYAVAYAVGLAIARGQSYGSRGSEKPKEVVTLFKNGAT